MNGPDPKPANGRRAPSAVPGRRAPKPATVWLLLALTPLACGEGGGAEARPAVEDRVVPVRTAAAELGTLARTAAVSGTVEPIRRLYVNSQVSSEVVAVRAEEGDGVARGEELARLDDRQLRAQLSAAEAAHQVAEAAHSRARQLREGEVVTEAEYEQARADLAAAAARLDQLRTQLEYSVIRAPAAGVVTERNVEVGNVVSPQTRLFAVDDLSTTVVRVRVSELDVVHLAPGATAEVTLDAFPDRPIEGRIRRVFPAADPATRLVPVEVALAGDNARLARPGFLARITFRLEEREGVVLVPAASVLTQSGRETVFVVEDGRAYRRAVTTGMGSGDRVEVVASLAAGERVVVEGQSGLRDGVAVREATAAAPLETGGDAGGAP